MNYESNIKKYYAFGFFSNIWFTLSISILFWQYFNINYEQIGWFELVGGILVFMLELPTGAVADLLSRKWSVFIGTIISALAPLIIGLSSTFFWFLIAGGIVWSIGGTFISGALSALIYDSLKEIKREKEFGKIRSRYAVYEGVATIIGTALGPLLFLVNVRIPYLLVAGGWFVGSIIVLFMKEPKIHTEHYSIKNHYKQIVKAINYSRTHEVGKYILFSVLLILPMQFFNGLFSEPYYLSIDYSIASFAIIIPIIRGSAILASSQAYKLEKYNEKKIIFILSAIFIISFILLSKINAPFLIIVVILMYMSRDVFDILFESFIHQRTVSSLRATVLSVKSMLYWILFGVGMLLVGKLGDNYSLSYVFIILSISTFILYVLSLILLKNGKVIENNKKLSQKVEII